MPARIARSAVWHIQDIDLEATLTADVMERFADAFLHAPCSPKTRRETIFLPNDASDRLFLLHHGRVVLGQRDTDGKEILYDVVSPGEIFGELSILGEEQRSTFARALERSMICSVAADDFQLMMGDKPHLLAALTTVVGDRERRLESRLADMVFKDAAARMATMLLRIAEVAGLADAQGTRLNVRLSQEEFGALIGTTRETVSQLLGKFEDAGWIARDGRTIIVTDGHALADLAGIEPPALTRL